jgi:hypothetical protein
MTIDRRRLVAGAAGAATLVASGAARAEDKLTTAIIQFPEPLVRVAPLAPGGGAADSFSVDAQGNGSLTGLGYTVPAHTRGPIKAKLQTLALTSADVKNLNDLIKGMVSASQYEKVRDYESTHASANISFFAFWSGGGSASYEKTHEEMRGFGLSEDNIKTIVRAMAEVAKNMSHVEIDFTVENVNNDYAVSGNLLLYTIAGTINTQNKQTQYRMLADKGIAGSDGATAPASGKIIPLS